MCAEHVFCVGQVLVPPLRELEAYIFERLFRYLWQKALLESVKREPSGGPMFSPHMMTPTHKASQHEDAIQRWLDALQVSCALSTKHCLPRLGHVCQVCGFVYQVWCVVITLRVDVTCPESLLPSMPATLSVQYRSILPLAIPLI